MSKKHEFLYESVVYNIDIAVTLWSLAEELCSAKLKLTAVHLCNPALRATLLTGVVMAPPLALPSNAKWQTPQRQ